MPRTLKPGERHKLGNGIEIVQHENHYVEWDVDARGRRHGAWTVKGVYEVPDEQPKPEPEAPQEPQYSAERQFALKRAIKRRLEDRRQGRI